MFCCCVTSSVIYSLITHAQEPIELLHSYELLYKVLLRLTFSSEVSVYRGVVVRSIFLDH